jgi:WXG100 family type VII secretion target
MAKADVDPAELRRFARDLKKFSSDLQALVGALNMRMRELEKSWRDQEQRKFSEELEKTTRAMGRFVELSDEHVTFLNRKAGLIEEYLRRR